MTPIVAVAAIVLDSAGRVLLVQRDRPPGAGRWSVPGGKLEPGERIAAAVAREVREETGLEVEVGPLAEIVERIAEGYHYVIHDHVARLAPQPGTLDPTAPPFGGAEARGRAGSLDPTAPPFGGAEARGRAASLDPTAPPFGGAEARGRAASLVAATDARAARFVPWADLATLPLTDGLVPVLERARATHAAWFGCKL